LAPSRLREQPLEVALAIEEPVVVAEDVELQRATACREECPDVGLVLRPGRRVDERLELETDQPLGVDHGDAQPGAAEERGPRPSEHLPGSLAPRVDEVGRGEPRRPGRVVRRVRAAVKAARALGDQLFV